MWSGLCSFTPHFYLLEANPALRHRLFSALEKGNPEEQLVFYQPGIGTYLDSRTSFLSPTVAKLLDMAIGSSLEHHVHEGYAFLQQNCEPALFLCPFFQMSRQRG